MAEPYEMVVYIHGVMNDRRGRSHRPEYDALHKGISAHLQARAWREATVVGVEWGWNFAGRARPRSHELLTTAQNRLGGRALAALKSQGDFTLNPLRHVVNGFRPLMLYGFGDMFYYVSADGKQAVRLAVTEQIVRALRPALRRSPVPPISLTLIGHSAGSVVALDFLFHLFFRNPGGRHVFLQEGSGRRVQSAASELDRLRALARRHRLRVRRLITMGSPITPLAHRSDAVLEILARGDRLDPADYGLDRHPSGFGAPLVGARWINVWDKDDPIAWPVEPLMGAASGSRVVQDVYVDVSDLASKAHDRYWTSRAVHRELASRW